MTIDQTSLKKLIESKVMTYLTKQHGLRVLVINTGDSTPWTQLELFEKEPLMVETPYLPIIIASHSALNDLWLIGVLPQDTPTTSQITGFMIYIHDEEAILDAFKIGIETLIMASNPNDLLRNTHVLAYEKALADLSSYRQFRVMNPFV